MKHFFYPDRKNLQSDDKNGSSYQKSKFWAFDETKKAIEVLEEYIKIDPNNIKVLNDTMSF